MLPNLSTLALSPGNVLVRCPECATLFQRASPTEACGCPECELGKRKREEEEKEKDDCACKKECACDDDDDDNVPDPNDPNMSEQWRNAYWYARGVSTGRLGMDSPEEWQVEAAKRKLAEQDEGPPPIVVPEPNDPNMDEQWRNAYRMAGGRAMSESDSEPPEPWQIEAAKRKLAQSDPDPDQPEFQSGCREEDCEPQFTHGCTEDDCEPKFTSLSGADEGRNAPMPRLGMPSKEEEEDGDAAWMFANFSEERDRQMEKRYGGLKFRAAEQVEK